MKRAITTSELSRVARYINDVSGIVIEASKSYLVESRLGPVLERQGAVSYQDLIRMALADTSLRLQHQIIDAITTNETSFFRDDHPFTLLAHKLIPDHFERVTKWSGSKRPRLDIWCAASSTGQEVYSIAIVLKELLFDLSKYWIKILGTDISAAALELASRGRYTAHELSRGLSPQRRERYFSQQDNLWQISDELRGVATFKPLNLLQPFNHLGSFDIIFCRNVAIYFSPENRRALFNQLAEQLRPHGVLVIGSTESLIGITDRLERQQFHSSIYYQKHHLRQQ